MPLTLMPSRILTCALDSIPESLVFSAAENLAPRSTIISNNPIGLNKIYYPRDFDKKAKKK